MTVPDTIVTAVLGTAIAQPSLDRMVRRPSTPITNPLRNRKNHHNDPRLNSEPRILNPEL